MLRPGAPAALALLTLLATLTSISVSIYIPAMPAMAYAFSAAPGQVQLTLTVFLLGIGTGQLLYGPASDRFGRRPVLLAGLALYTVGSAACAAAPGIEALLVARLVQAIGGSAGMALVRAIIRDTYPRAAIPGALAMITGAMAISPALAPVLGSHLFLAFGWRATFGFLIAFGLLLMAVVAVLLPETNTVRDPRALDPRTILRNYAQLLRTRVFLGYMLTGGFVFSAVFAYTAAAPFILMGRLGMTADRFAYMMILTTVCYVAGTVAAPRLVRRLSIAGAVLVGAGLAVAGATAMATVWASGWVLVASVVGSMMVYSLGIGIALPTTMAGGIEPYPTMAGAASALLGCAQMVSGALSSLAVALLGGGVAAVALVLAACSLAGLAARLALVGFRLR